MHESNGYYVSITRVSIIDANNLDKKIFVNSIPNLLDVILYLYYLSLMNFNRFLLKT